VGLELRLLGEPELRFDGARLNVKLLPRCMPLLAHLIVNRARAVSRATAATLLWPDDLEEDARTNLRRHLHVIASAFRSIGRDGAIDAGKTQIAWRGGDDVWVDLIAFEEAAAAGRLDEAIASYGGDFLEDVYDDWVLDVREPLRTRYHNAILEAAERELIQRRFTRVVELADSLLRADEWREDALRLKMTALYKTGERNAALAAYERFAANLRAEMAVDPMPETHGLREAIVANIPLGAIEEHDDAPAEGLPKLMLPFIGRQREMERLRSLWNRAAHGRGSTVFITGDAGIGKSRLVREFAALVKRQGGIVIAGGTAHPELAPYQAVSEALRRALPLPAGADVPETALRALADLLPELFALHGFEALPRIPADAARTRLRDAIARFIAAQARQKPLLLVLEDLQWAGSDTLELVLDLARRAGSMPLFIACSVRSGVANRQLSELRRALTQEQRAATVSLAAIPAGHFAEIGRSGSAFSEIPAAVLEHAATLSAGNPLFAAMLLQMYLQSGIAPSEETAARSLAESIERRLSAFDPLTRTIAQAAAAIGTAFSADFVSKIGGWTESEVFHAIDALLDGEIIREAGSAQLEYAFSHALIARVLYDGLTEEALRGRHRRIAALLDGQSDAAFAARIARHWHLARNPARARAAFERAIGHARSLYAWSDARRLALEALAVCETDAERFEILQSAAPVAAVDGNAQWTDAIRELERLARAIESPDALATALSLKARNARMRDDRETPQQCARELEALAHATRSDEHAMLAAIVRGYVYQFEGDQVSAIDAFERALALGNDGDTDASLSFEIRERLIIALVSSSRIDDARAHLLAAREAHRDEPLALIRIAFAACAVGMNAGDLQLLAESASELLDLAERMGHVMMQISAHVYLGEALHAWPARARVHWAKALELSHGSVLGANAALNRGYHEMFYGRFDLAKTLGEESLAISRAVGVPYLKTQVLVNLALVTVVIGDPREALRLVVEAQSTGVHKRQPLVDAAVSSALGAVQAALGEHRDALRTLRHAVDMRVATGSRAGLMHAQAQLLECLLAAGETREAAELAERIERTIDDEVLNAVPSATFVYAQLARAAAAHGEREAQQRRRDRGRALAQQMLERIDDTETQQAFSALPEQRYLLALTTA
jgi:DNA-binding SARP family transcriptional activator/energy-coupling factor transporter ATP-binding protein EcfA2